MSTILPCSYFYSEISCFDQNIESLLSQIPHKERVVSLIFFGPTEDTLYEKELSNIHSIVAGHFGSVFPLVSYIAQSLMDPQKMAVEVHYIPAAECSAS